MSYNSERHHRRSIRLQAYDYTKSGAYFITIVTKDRICLLGEAVDGEVQLNEYGQMVAEELARTAETRPTVSLDALAVMPNHIHGVVVINDRRGTLQRAPSLPATP